MKFGDFEIDILTITVICITIYGVARFFAPGLCP